jgi:hypothetical protein
MLKMNVLHIILFDKWEETGMKIKDTVVFNIPVPITQYPAT